MFLCAYVLCGAITDFEDETYLLDTEDEEADGETVEPQSVTSSSTSVRVLSAPLVSVLVKPQSSASASCDSEYVSLSLKLSSTTSRLLPTTAAGLRLQQKPPTKAPKQKHHL